MGLEDNYGKIPLRRVFKPFMEAVFDTTDGHDHDGTNSKALSPSAVIANDAISTVKIQDNAVTADKIAANAVTGAKILDEAITGAKIPAQTITTTHLADTNVTAAKIGADAVIEAKIQNGAVTADKIGADAVIEAKIQNGAVTADKIGTDAVIEAKLQDGAVTAAKIGADAVIEAKIQDGAVVEAKLGAGAVTAAKIGTGAVTAAKLNADIAGDGLALNGGTNALEITVDDSTIETSADTIQVKALGIDTAHLAAGAVSNAKLANISQGYIKVGGAADAPTDLDASGDGKILVGDGTDLNSVAVSGDVALANTGKMTLTGVESTDFELAQGTANNRIKLVANADTTDALLTVTSDALTEARTATFPDATGIIVLGDATQFVENKSFDELVLGDGTSKFMETKIVDVTSSALSGATATITLGIPAGALLIGVTLNNDTAVTNGGDDTYTAAFSGGSTIALNGGTAIAAAQNTKTKEFIDANAASAITDNTTNILLTPQAADFTGGVVRAVVVYAEMVDLPDAV